MGNDIAERSAQTARAQITAGLSLEAANEAQRNLETVIARLAAGTAEIRAQGTETAHSAIPETELVAATTKLARDTGRAVDIAQHARTELFHQAGIQDGLFARWLSSDPVGATLYIYHVLTQAHRRAADGVPDDQTDTIRITALRDAMADVNRLAERLASAVGEPFADAVTVVAEWRTLGVGVPAGGPGSLFETGTEEVSPGRARTREWLENLPLAELSVLANLLNRARRGEEAMSGVDQATAERVWPILSAMTKRLVAGAAGVIREDPIPELPQAALRRLRDRPPVVGEFSPATYVGLIEQELRPIGRGDRWSLSVIPRLPARPQSPPRPIASETGETEPELIRSLWATPPGRPRPA